MEKEIEEIIITATEFYYNKLKKLENAENKLNEDNVLDIARILALNDITTIWQKDLENAMSGNEQIDELINNIFKNNNTIQWTSLKKELQTTNRQNDEFLLEIVNFKNSISCYDENEDFRKFINKMTSNLFKIKNTAHISKNDGCLSDFYDTFTNNIYTMFRDYEVECLDNTVIVNKKISIDKGNKRETNFGIGFDSQEDNVSHQSIVSNISFNILERKLLKVITNEFIQSKGKNELYIPVEKINMYLFEDTSSSLTTRNRTKLIQTIERMNNKYVYYDVENSCYIKSNKLRKEEFKKNGLEKLIEIQVASFSSFNKSSDGNIANKIKGIYCKLGDFWKIRYALKQINNKFPTKELLNTNDKFCIADKLLYKTHLRQRKIFILDLMKELYFFKKDGMIKENNLYDELIDNSHQKKLFDGFTDNLLEILEDFINLKIIKSFDIYNEDKKLTEDKSERDEDDNIIKKMVRFKNGKKIKFEQIAMNTIYIKLEYNNVSKKRKKPSVKTKHLGEKN